MRLTLKSALAIATLWLSGLIAGIMLAPQALACDQGTWADPTHYYICQPYPPAYSPGYQQPPSNIPLPPNSQLYPH